MDDLEKFLKDIPGESAPVGVFYKYLPEYDDIRSIRKQDEEFFPSSLKEGSNYNREWRKLCAICEDLLENKTKDFQIAIWLLEGWYYCHGIEGIIRGIKLLLLMIDKYWVYAYPPLEDDLEYRLAPFSWLNEKFCEKFVFIKITTPQIMDETAHSYADWLDMKRLEMLLQKSKNPGSAKEKAIQEGRVIPEHFIKSFERTPLETLKKTFQNLEILENDLDLLNHKLDEITNQQGVSFVRLKTMTQEIKFLIGNNIPPEPEIIPEPEPLLEPEVTPQAEAEIIVAKEESDPLPSSQFDEQPQKNEYSREIAYQELEKIATYLESIEPHSPAPYLIRRSIQWGNMNLAELYEDLLINEGNLAQVMRLLGLGTKEIPIANPGKKR